MRSEAPRLSDIVTASERVRNLVAGVSLEEFEIDWQRQWLVERGLEIISEASRHLSDDLKARHSEIPWRRVAGIGNVLRHDYQNIAAPVMWTLATGELAELEDACREELARGEDGETS